MIVSLTGKADNFELVFVKQLNNTWAAEVPPNIETGRYIVELCAVDHAGNIGWWRGVLHMSQNQRVTLEVLTDEYQAWLMNDIQIDINERSIEITLKSDIEEKVVSRYAVEFAYKAV